MDTATVAVTSHVDLVRGRGTWRRVGALPVTGVLVLALLAVTAYLDTHANDVDAVVDWASTNLHNLAEHPVASLVTSMFVVPGDPWPELIVLALSCAVVERALGSRRALLIALAGQVIATLLTEYGAAVASHLQLVAPSSSHRIDVGVSYAMFALLGAAAVVLPRRWRFAAVSAVLAAVVVPLALHPGMTATGHVLSVLCGLILYVTEKPSAP